MSDTTKTPDNVIPKRRSSDWKKPSSVPRPDVFDWAAEPGVVVMEAPAVARVTAALSGARALLGVLFQHEMDRDEDDEDADSMTRWRAVSRSQRRTRKEARPSGPPARTAATPPRPSSSGAPPETPASTCTTAAPSNMPSG